MTRKTIGILGFFAAKQKSSRKGNKQSDSVAIKMNGSDALQAPSSNEVNSVRAGH